MPRTRVPNARSTFFMVLFCLSPCKSHFWVLWMWDVFSLQMQLTMDICHQQVHILFRIIYVGLKLFCWHIMIVFFLIHQRVPNCFGFYDYDCCCAVNTEIKLTILRLSHKRLLQAWLFYIHNHLLILPFNFPCSRTMFQGPMHAV